MAGTSRSEALVAAQVTPLPRRQRSQCHAANPQPTHGRDLQAGSGDRHAQALGRQALAGEAQALGQGETATEVFTYTATDSHGATSVSTLTVTVTGTNDRPVITSTAADAAGAVTEQGVLNPEEPTTTSGTLTASAIMGTASEPKPAPKPLLLIPSSSTAGMATA